MKGKDKMGKNVDELKENEDEEIPGYVFFIILTKGKDLTEKATVLYTPWNQLLRTEV